MHPFTYSPAIKSLFGKALSEIVPHDMTDNINLFFFINKNMASVPVRDERYLVIYTHNVSTREHI